MRRPLSQAPRTPTQEFAGYREKLFFVPGRTASTLHFIRVPYGARMRSDKLELIFVGGLGPIKAVDLALRGAAPLLQTGRARFTIVGDGPERANLSNSLDPLESRELSRSVDGYTIVRS